MTTIILSHDRPETQAGALVRARNKLLSQLAGLVTICYETRIGDDGWDDAWLILECFTPGCGHWRQAYVEVSHDRPADMERRYLESLKRGGCQHTGIAEVYLDLLALESPEEVAK